MKNDDLNQIKKKKLHRNHGSCDVREWVHQLGGCTLQHAYRHKRLGSISFVSQFGQHQPFRLNFVNK